MLHDIVLGADLLLKGCGWCPRKNSPVKKDDEDLLKNSENKIKNRQLITRFYKQDAKISKNPSNFEEIKTEDLNPVLSKNEPRKFTTVWQIILNHQKNHKNNETTDNLLEKNPRKEFIGIQAIREKIEIRRAKFVSRLVKKKAKNLSFFRQFYQISAINAICPCKL